MKLKNYSKGQIAQLKIQLMAAKKNLLCSLPTVGATRYDLIMDNKGTLSRTQIKYCNRKASRVKNCLELQLYNKAFRNFYSRSEIDLLLVFIPKLDIILKFEADEFHKRKTIFIHLTDEKSNFYYKNFIW
jgi:hypothetical protein